MVFLSFFLSFFIYCNTLSRGLRAGGQSLKGMMFFSAVKVNGSSLELSTRRLFPRKGLTSWLSFVMSNCEVVTFPLVSWVMFGA